LKESHAFTILNAPAATSAISSRNQRAEIVLGARVMGKWTKTLNDHALSTAINALSTYVHGTPGPESEVAIMIDGPYSSLVFDCGKYENIVFVAGGSGATFAIGLLDDLVGRVVKHRRANGEKTRHIEFIWYIRTHGMYHSWSLDMKFNPFIFDRVHVMVFSNPY
jgi:ferric-chelate reductase